MSLFSKAAKFAKSPQGKKALDKAQDYAKSPQGKKQVETLKKRFGGPKK